MRFISNLRRNLHFFKYNVKPFRPRMVLSHVWRRLRSRTGGRQGFRIIDLALTYNCNFTCEHCSALTMVRDAPVLTLDDYREIVRQAKDLDVLSWNLTGGEPLLLDWLEDLIPILEPSTHYISVQTNCALLDKERAERLARLGVNCITTSLDSVDEGTHDAFRGFPGSYEQVLRAVKIAHDAGMQALIGTLVTHQNLRSRELERLIELGNEHGAIVLFNLAVPCGRWQGRHEFVLHGDDRQYLLDLMARYPMTSTDHEIGRNKVGCPAGMEKVYITPYGDVIPCPFIHVSFGNIHETPLVEIVERMHNIPYFNSYQNICVAAEDLEFHEKVMQKLPCTGNRLPVFYSEIFGPPDE